MTDKRLAALSPHQLELLGEVLSRRATNPGELLKKAEANTLTSTERVWICEMISAEFAASGLDADSEPLPRGLALEELLDAVNRPNVTP